MAQQIHDLDIYGASEYSGNPTVHIDEEAVKNAFTLWLSSKMGDFVKNPDLGGVLDRTLFKQIDERKAEQLKFSISNAIRDRFSPEVKLTQLRVNPDYENRMWEIDIRYNDPFTQKEQSLSVYTKDLTQRVTQEFVEIESTGENLRNFCVIKKVDMTGKLLVYSSERERWVWGEYLFPTSFDHTSPYFSEILAIANT